jgi:hypothetical protein
MSNAIKDILDNASAVTNDLANGADSIMHLIEGQGEAVPYIILQSSIVNPNGTQTGQVIDEWDVSVFIISNYLYDEGASIGVHTIGANVRTALHDTSGTYAGENVAGVVFRDQLPPQIIQANTVQRVMMEQTYTMHIHR